MQQAVNPVSARIRLQETSWLQGRSLQFQCCTMVKKLNKRITIINIIAIIVVIFVGGISIFLTDEELVPVPRTLYDWAGPGSCWAFNAQGAGANPDLPEMAELFKMYAQMGTPLHIRSVEAYREMLLPWQPNGDDFISLLEWHGFDQSEMSAEDQKAFGPAGAGYGVYLSK